MRHSKRKTTPKVVNGVVLRKNNHRFTPDYFNTEQDQVLLRVEKPGKGYKHFLNKRDLKTFVELLPNWDVLSVGLRSIVLESGYSDYDGIYYYEGVICLSAWNKEQAVLMSPAYYEAHADLLKRLGVPTNESEKGVYCDFSIEQIKAYQLLHILLHELGHHYDRLCTKQQIRPGRGEDFAENYAFQYEEQIWIAYQDAFGVVFI